MKHLLGLKTASRDEIQGLIDDAFYLKEKVLRADVKSLPLLKGKSVITFFF